MKKDFGKVLKTKVMELFSSHFPDFKFYPLKGHPYYASNELVFVKKENIAWLILIALPNPKKSTFTIEYGWSKNHRLPELPGRPSIVFDDENKFEKAEFVERIGVFFAERGDFHWRVSEENIKESVERINQYVLPTFEQLQKQG
jgi:hypothetical protein